MTSKADPYDVFNYDGVVAYRLPFVYYTNSESFNDHLTQRGVTSSVSTVDNGISRRGVGHLYPGELEQEVHFLSLVSSDVDDIENRGDVLSRTDSTTFTSGFVYGVNLYDIPDDAPTYYVCMNESDSNYFVTTNKDCDGNSINARYTRGQYPAIFLDGQCCSDICEGLLIDVRNTSAIDANSRRYTGLYGQITVSVTGGQGDFTYNVTNSTTGVDTTATSDESEYEFTGLAYTTDNQAPFKITVTDANGCVGIAYINLVVREGDFDVIQGCTDSDSFLHNGSATFNTGCLYCLATDNRGAAYGGLGFGTTSGTAQTTGEDLFSNENSRITDATAVDSSSGKIYLRASVHPAALAEISNDGSYAYAMGLYSLGNSENANSITKAEINALSATSTAASLENEFTSLAPGWYAIKLSVTGVTTLSACFSIFRFKVGYGGCQDVEADNYDRNASYNVPQTCTYTCPEQEINIITNATDVTCVKTVTLARIDPDSTVTWIVGSERYEGVGPHLAQAGSYVTVYVENIRTGCTSSGELSIPNEDCLSMPIMSRSGDPNYIENYEQILEAANQGGDMTITQMMSIMPLGSGGCTDATAYNYNCDAIYDDGTCVPVVTGCTDPTSSNFYVRANVDDGSCLDLIPGCLNPNALNYNPMATVNVPVMCNFGTGYGEEPFRVSTNGYIDCPATAIGLDVTATTSTILLQYDLPPFTVIQEGSQISAWQIPVGGNVTMDGYSAYDFTFPLHESGIESQATWLITGLNSSVYGTDITYNNVNVGGWNSADGSFYTDDSGGLTYGSSAAVADSGSVGFGYYIFEQKLIFGGKTHYKRFYTPIPHGVVGDICASTYDFDFSPHPSNRCSDPLAVNYNGASTLTVEMLADRLLQAQNNIGMAVNNVVWANQNGAATCDYRGDKICLPPRIDENIQYLEKCIMNGSVNWYNKHITGGQDLCEDMALWTTILIKYLVSRKGLDCIFNCRDSATPNYSPETCEDKWVDNGSQVLAYANTTGYQQTGMLGLGEYIKVDTPAPWMGNTASDAIFEVSTECGKNCGNPYGNGGAQFNFRLCKDDKTFSTYTVNYLDKFFKFATKYCQSCGPCSFDVGNSNNFKVPTESFAYSIDSDGQLTVGGIFLEIDGENLEGENDTGGVK